MKRIIVVVALVAAAYAGLIVSALAQEAVSKAKAAAFDSRMFGGPALASAHACFVRRYDAEHLAQHPKQKVSAMKLLVRTEYAPDDKTINYSYRIGVRYRDRAGDFDTIGYCDHAIATENGRDVHFECDVDCEGVGLTIALSKDDKSAIARPGHIMVRDRSKPDEDQREALSAGADDKIFRVDRADISECAELVTDQKELAALGHK
ncbi:hypothetical protein [Bradyrhizobium jicamae]|uniref:hypothetical protein n=1 Tax=Bradyrhizobium jicamae TaxID=280332 RepID=UPI001BA69EC6|nr:hypothetical protein [Bradyrhizobium jicamae]MBR0931819.1 hypothetical protein [Bradyrhizobium jicamae]